MINNTSFIELNTKAYKSNIRFLKKVIGENVKISSVIKGNAYGHGYEQIIKLAESSGINHFSVFSAFEAQQAIKFTSSKSDIMILGFIAEVDLHWVINNEIEFYIFSYEGLKKSIKLANHLDKKAKVHLELETGFNRTGLETEEFDKTITLILNNHKYVKVSGICTHFAGAESIANYVRVQNQLTNFNKFHKYFTEKGIHPQYIHTASSSASLLYPDMRFNLVRIGIAQYGFWPTPEVLITRSNLYGDKESSLKRVISWKSEIMSVKNISKGEFIGYGNSFQAPKNMQIAIIPVGYNNGYSRSLSNKGHVLVHGKRADVIGVVTMNTISVNITDIENVTPGDEVILIGNYNKNKITVASFSEMSNNLNYQVLVRLPKNIPRLIVN